VAGDESPRRHHADEPLGEHPINRFVMALTSGELDQDGGRDTHRVPPSSGRTQAGPNQLVPAWVLSGMSERRESFAVEGQDGHSASKRSTNSSGTSPNCSSSSLR
jgi:hypothetical protein